LKQLQPMGISVPLPMNNPEQILWLWDEAAPEPQERHPPAAGAAMTGVAGAGAGAGVWAEATESDAIRPSPTANNLIVFTRMRTPSR
jgi:hypothetical protein